MTPLDSVYTLDNVSKVSDLTGSLLGADRGSRWRAETHRGAATHLLGGGRILLLGIGARLLLLAVIAVGSFAYVGWIGWLVLIGFALIQFVWPLLAVGANSRWVRLAPTARGESVGLFNAATSLAAALGLRWPG